MLGVYSSLFIYENDENVVGENFKFKHTHTHGQTQVDAKMAK